jgi:hypothetical protein
MKITPRALPTPIPAFAPVENLWQSVRLAPEVEVFCSACVVVTGHEVVEVDCCTCVEAEEEECEAEELVVLKEGEGRIEKPGLKS